MSEKDPRTTPARGRPRKGYAIDEWSCDRDGLIELFGPGLKLGPDRHEHAHHDGCYYAHDHEGGGTPHNHHVPREPRPG